MKNRARVSFGPGAPSLILIFVVLALSIFGMLSLLNSRNDAKLSERSVEVIKQVYEFNCAAEETRAMIDAVLKQAADNAADDAEYMEQIEAMLPEDLEIDGRDIIWTETDGIRNLHCVIRVLPAGGDEREMWIRHTVVSVIAEEAEEEEMFEW